MARQPRKHPDRKSRGSLSEEGEKKVRKQASDTIRNLQSLSPEELAEAGRKGAQLTPGQTEERILYILKQISTGESHVSLRDKICERYNICPSSANIWLNRAYTYLKEESAKFRDSVAEINLQRFDDLYRRSIENNDRIAAIAALREQNKMVGAYAPAQSEQKIEAQVAEDIRITFGS